MVSSCADYFLIASISFYSVKSSVNPFLSQASCHLHSFLNLCIQKLHDMQ